MHAAMRPGRCTIDDGALVRAKPGARLCVCGARCAFFMAFFVTHS